MEEVEVFTSLSAGARRLTTDNAWIRVFAAIVIGIMAHWLWEALVAFLTTDIWDVGTPLVWLARVVVALIAAAFSFVGIFAQIAALTGPTRYFTVFTLAFAVDAFTGPAVSALAGAGPVPAPQTALSLLGI